MKTLLILGILLAGIGAGFEYQMEQNHATAYVGQLADFKAKQAQLTADNQKLADANAELNKTLAAEEGQASDLNSKLAAPSAAGGAPPNAAPAPTH